MLIVYNLSSMRAIKVFLIPGMIMRKLGLAKLYYWFNK
jgi:hypothetical protein